MIFTDGQTCIVTQVLCTVVNVDAVGKKLQHDAMRISVFCLNFQETNKI